ncbi:MAG: flagellar basal body L-ring protein FlgH [Epsilonproteobacteria bacterium]|nr:flagellar basal body L-ring protein FlgH [Campylobacterota bacterium]
MRNKLIIIMAYIVLLFTGCTTHQVEPQMSMKAPVYVDQTTKSSCNTLHMNRTHEGSIYGKGANPLFSDKKAMNVHDIVTVVIDENTFQSSQGNKNISDTSTNNMGGGVFTGATSGGLTSGVAKTLNGLTDIGFKTNSNNTFSGTGSQSRNEKFTATISARVVKVLNNGNYFIDGSRQLLLNGTKQMIRITGVIRPYDIDQTNTIDSKYVADAKIHYATEGDIKQATNRPWGSRMVDSIWPF